MKLPTCSLMKLVVPADLLCTCRSRYSRPCLRSSNPNTAYLSRRSKLALKFSDRRLLVAGWVLVGGEQREWENKRKSRVRQTNRQTETD